MSYSFFFSFHSLCSQPWPVLGVLGRLRCKFYFATSAVSRGNLALSKVIRLEFVLKKPFSEAEKSLQVREISHDVPPAF